MRRTAKSAHITKWLFDFSMESYVMSDHQLRFKGPGFDFDAKGWIAIIAAILIAAAILGLPFLLHR